MTSNTSSGGAAIVQRDRAERPEPAADADVERQAGTGDERGTRGEQGAGDRGAQRERHGLVLQGWDTRRVADLARSDAVDLPALRRRRSTRS